MINEEVEYMVLSGSTAKVIMTKTRSKLADVKYAALQLKREGVINDEEAQKYFNAQESTPRTSTTTKAKAPTKRRGRPAKTDMAEDAPAPAKTDMAEDAPAPPIKRRGRRATPVS